MSKMQDAREVLRKAEGALNELIENALRNQQYEDVAAIAALADGLVQLRTAQVKVGDTRDRTKIQYSTKKKTDLPRKTPGVKKTTQTKSGKKATLRQNQNQFPQFVQDGDRLVKIGWSKKNKRSYEHRAPKESVIAFLQHLMASVSEGELFTVEGLLPAHDPSTEAEIPAYQAYMTIAWLRRTNMIERKGRDGYILMRNSSSESDFEQLWDTLPTK